jgi:hypothetical protein
MVTIAIAVGTPIVWETPNTAWETLDNFGYTEANRLEKNLDNLKLECENIISAYLYCGAWNNVCGRQGTEL